MYIEDFVTIDVQKTFRSTLEEGQQRLERTLPSLLATGAVGGIDVGMGVLALLLVQQATGNETASSIAFGIGFLFLTLANSELFTENFLVPISAIVARRSTVLSLIRLWAGTLVMNLIGGWIITGLVILAVPQVRSAAISVGSHFVQQGTGSTAFAGALLGGAIITLMTWMQHATDSVPGRLAAAVSAAFLLASGHLNHAIVMSLEVFAAIHAGAPFGYGTWLPMLGWASLGNIIGGIGFVTILRLVQVGAEHINEERSQVAAAKDSKYDAKKK